ASDECWKRDRRIADPYADPHIGEFRQLGAPAVSFGTGRLPPQGAATLNLKDDPMLDKRMQDALNKQINHEMAAAYNYLAMAAHFEARNLSGFATWMHHQRAEELTHAQKLIQYVLDRGGQVELSGIEKPRTNYDSPQAVFAK